MSIDLDDPRLTAYALGELDPADRETFEANLRDDPEGRAFVAGIQDTARLLTEELSHESTPGLDPARRGAIEGEIAKPALTMTPAPTAKKRRFPILELAIAAGIIGVCFALLMPATQSAREAARRNGQVDFAYAESTPTPIASARRSKPFGRSYADADRPATSAPSGLAVTVNEKGDATAVVDSLATSPGGDAASNSVRGLKLNSLMDGTSTTNLPQLVAKTEAAESGRNRSVRKDPDQRVASGRMGSGGSSMEMGGIGGGMAGMGMPGRGGHAAGRDQVRYKANFEDHYRTHGGLGPGGPDPKAGPTAKDNLGQRGPITVGTAGPGIANSTPNLSPTEGFAKNTPAALGEAKNQFGYLPSDAKANNGPAQPNSSSTYHLGINVPLPIGQNRNQGVDKSKDLALQQAPPAGGNPSPATKPEAESLKEAVQLVDGKQAALAKKLAEVQVIRQEAVPVAREAEVERAKVNREEYAKFYDNPFVNVVPDHELSTFSIDVDTASYANVRRFLSQGQLPPVDAVRIEEMINYFTYDDPALKDDTPFSVNVEIAACPWNAGHRLARIGLKGKSIDVDKRPATSLVFLVDVSGSMGDLNKLPLLKAGMKLLVEQLTENDRVAIVTYANGTRVALPSTSCDHKADVLAALDNLQAGGGTNGGAGIELAYQQAATHFIKGGTNRVILGTDGDFNVGVSMPELLAKSEERAKGGIFLSVLGFGEGNIQEAFMEQLADKGNGNYSYIDTIQEARKVLVQQMSGTLNVIAKDVKIQLEFNPAKVGSYRLIGYENRVMANEDFRNDKKDAGEIGAGHSVTALYEITPVGKPVAIAANDKPLKYRRAIKLDAPAAEEVSPEMLTVSLRYKQPDGDVAKEINRGVVDDGRDFGRASIDMKFSAAVAGFGMLLRESPNKGTLTYPAVREIAGSAVGEDKNGYRKEFLGLVEQARQITGH